MEKNKPPELMYKDGSPMRTHKSKIIEELMNEDKQQTVMNELLVWIRKTLPMDLDYPRMIEDKIESLISKEKEQIMNDFMAGKWDWAEHTEGKESKDPAEYYNETYKK